MPRRRQLPPVSTTHLFPSPADVDELGDDWLTAIPARCPCGYQLEDGSRRNRCRAVAVHLEEQGVLKLDHIRDARARIPNGPGKIHDDAIDGPRPGR